MGIYRSEKETTGEDSRDRPGAQAEPGRTRDDSRQAQDKAMERRRIAWRLQKLKKGPVRRSVERGLGLY